MSGETKTSGLIGGALFAAALAALAVPGCTAGPPPDPAASADHPANPDAAHLPLPTAPAEPPATRPATPATTPAAAAYACPHHPEVTSSDPDARCPKCGMRLQPAKPSTGDGGHGGHHR